MKSKIYITFLTVLALFFSAVNQTSAQCTQNFDGVTAPALPAGWTATTNIFGAGTTPWVTSTTTPFSAPNAAFTNDPATISDEWLISPNFPINSATAQLTFRRNNILESGFDGMVLEMRIGAGAYQDILAAGGTFVAGAYNGTISAAFGSPIAGRQAWTGNSGGYVITTVNLPAAANGQNINLRWRRATDNSVASTGARVDDITITSCGAPPPAPCDQNFDAITPPAFPTNWTATTGTACAGTAAWATTNTTFFNVPNSVITNDPNCISDEYLNSPIIRVTSATATMTFMRSNDLESGFDGMVLEVSLNGGAFQDIIAAGGSFAAGGYNGTISSAFGSPIAGRDAWTDNSGGFVTTTVNMPASANGQTVVFRWRRATDSSVGAVGATIDAITFTGMDCACIITCPANVIVSNDANQCGAVATYTVPTFSGTCGTVTTSPASGSFFPVGTTTITATATSGATCTFTVRVNDVQPPTITCPANITVNNTAGQCGAVVTFTPTASDNCPVGLTITSVPASGSFFPKGTTTVTSTARDASGNTANCTFTVTVNDTQAPIITCPANITVQNGAGICGAVVNYNLPTVTDNCPLPGAITLTQNTNNNTITTGTGIACGSGNNHFWRAYNLAPLGLSGPLTITSVRFGVEVNATPQTATVRLYTSAGAFPAGTLTQIASQTVSITNAPGAFYTANFATPPTVAVNAIVAVEVDVPTGGMWPGANQLGETAPAYVSSTNCGVPNPVTLASLGFTSHTIIDIAGTTPSAGVLTQTAGLASGSTFPVGTTTNAFRATDAAGNTSTCSFTVRVNDTQAPSITCPANITATTPAGSCTATVNYTAVTATDNCPGVITALTAGLASGSAFPIGVTTVSWMATDAAGNTSNCSFTVTVLDGQLPVITAQPTNRFICVGSNAVFSVTATNVVTYQWQSWNGTAWVNIAGANASTLTLSSVTVSMNTNSYRVIINGLCTTNIISGFATLYVNTLPTIDLVASQSPLLIPGQRISITAAVSPAGGTISWFKNNVLMSGVTSFTLSNLSVDDVGTYRAVYTDLNGCVKTSADLTVIGLSSDKLWVYPNPTSGRFQVRFYNQVNEPVTLNIYDPKGARVYSRKLVTTIPYTRIDVDLSKNSSGSYIVEIRNSQDKQVGGRQVMIQH